MNRRKMLSLSSSTTYVAISLAALYGTAGVYLTRRARAAMPSSSGMQCRVTHTDAEWRKILSPAAYDVLRKAGTEAPFTSPLLHEERQGIFSCAGCALPLYASATKYDSGTGWPSFWDRLPNAILTSADYSFGMARTEVHCSQCGGHLGHVFPDGPPPTGLRYCMNGVALSFTPRTA
jgi:peptide-methionine (R)-S-oxide reductase